MPVALIIAFVASLGLHAAALFGPDIDLSTEPESPPLVAELRPLPKPLPQVEPEKKPEKPAPVKPRTPRRKAQPALRATPVLSVPDESPVRNSSKVAESASALEPAARPGPSPTSASPEPEVAPVVPRLPPHGTILYRVDLGDSNFQIGVSRNEWEIVDGRYRLTSVVETSGLVWLFKAYRIDMESQGIVTDEGLRPDSFALQRNGQKVKEKAFFDWESMKIRVGDQPDQILTDGAQDVLSFNYQLGYMSHPEAGTTLSIATGKKYGIYRLEVLGDEQIEVPAGVLRTLHLRAPGDNTTELWLAYDYLLLPVKIRHVNAKGDSLVQVATEIRLDRQ
jgi:hypothetical protein